MSDGFIIIDKPAGKTSHDLVNIVRRIAGTRKVGHTGTLDPFATGVLPVAVGEGTKAIQFLDESVKEYRGVLMLGESTDTQDYTGQILHRGEWQGLTRDDVEEAIKGFLGRGKQLPPMFSAIKRNGVPLYKLARRGEEVDRESRHIEIFSIEIERFELPEVEFAVRCSRGVYVRTLASDIGERLGCWGHLAGLRRVRSGPFAIGEAVSPGELAADAEKGRLGRHLISCFSALSHLRPLAISGSGAQRVARGISPAQKEFEEFPASGLEPGELVRISRGETLLAVAQNVRKANNEAETLRLLRVFNEH